MKNWVEKYYLPLLTASFILMVASLILYWQGVITNNQAAIGGLAFGGVLGVLLIKDVNTKN